MTDTTSNGRDIVRVRDAQRRLVGAPPLKLGEVELAMANVKGQLVVFRGLLQGYQQRSETHKPVEFTLTIHVTEHDDGDGSVPT